ncbi:hypothetical protein [Sulfuricurvum sp.]|uniref:hypothetical protein n=1 Tax=Sulfuricurvum sp. TaxID=2025608 RepID=UPI003BB165E6
MRVTIDNIGEYLHLFSEKNTDFGSPAWAEPIFAAMIRAYQNHEKLTINIGNGYIRNMILSEYQSHKSYSPIECIFQRADVDKIANHITQIMLKNFHELSPKDQKDLRDYLQYLFTELMNNVADHSHSSVGGYAMAQYFPSNRKIQFVVADRGVGFLRNLLLNFDDVDNELAAIIKALQKGITSTEAVMYGAHKNAGFGLYAMYEILNMTGGKFVIISNDALLRYSNGSYSTETLSPPWNGVVVAFEFEEANINYDMDYFRKNYLWKEALEEEDEDFYV